MNISERIAAAIQHANQTLGKNQKTLAEEAGVSGAWISKLSNPERMNNLGADKIFRFARATGCRAEWISEGTGPMTVTGLMYPGEYSIKSTPTIEIPFYKQGLSVNENSKESAYYSVNLSVLTELNLDSAHLLAFTADDESMSHTIKLGDRLLIDTSQNTPKSQMVFAVSHQDKSIRICRLIQTLSDGWLIRSDNEDKRIFPDEKNVNLNKIDILGRIVWRGGPI